MSSPANSRRRAVRVLAPVALLATLLSGCGGSESEATRTGAQSLQQAMDASSRAIDGVRGTRTSLDNLAASLQTATDQTGDVIGVLGAESDDDAVVVVAAAREQRTFLQQAQRAAQARSRATAQTAVTQARSAGKRASDAYAKTARDAPDLAGLLPASTTFNTGRLRDAVLKVNPPKGGGAKSASKSTTASGSSSGGGTSGSNCGDGVTANGNTSCAFAKNVADAYRGSGGDSVIDVYSPVTQRSYTMYCSVGAIPTVCTGGNNARVTIR